MGLKPERCHPRREPDHSPLDRSKSLFITGGRVPSYLDLLPRWPPAPYGLMEKPYHPSYTGVNPVAGAREYTSEQVHCRKVSLIYDWLPSDRDVEAWLRRTPYSLETGRTEGSWVVKYFEFRAPIKPLPEVGFIGDLWISWNTLDPSIWFKVHENEWEKWGGCASSVRERMNAQHPFLDKAYLWLSPGDFFFVDKIPNAKLSLRWERPYRIRKVAPISRIIDPDSRDPPKKVPTHPVYLPSVRTIVRTLCPNMSRVSNPVSPPHPVNHGEGRDGDSMVATTSRARAEDLERSFPVEEIVLGDDVKIDWDWWGSGDDGDPEDETTQVGSSQPQVLDFVQTPSPVAPPNDSRYHPYQPKMPFKKFKPPARYTKGTRKTTTSPGDTCSAPASSFTSTSSTVVDLTTPNPQSPAKSIDLPLAVDNEMIADPQEQTVPFQNTHTYPQKPSQSALNGVGKILLDDGYDQPGVWALLPPELDDTRGHLAAELPVPVLDLELETLHKIRRLLHQDGFAQSGILILKMDDPSGG